MENTNNNTNNNMDLNMDQSTNQSTSQSMNQSTSQSMNQSTNNSWDNNQESSSTYGYSYINQEQKNPNNIWRAEDTASSQEQSASSQGSSYSGTYGSSYSGTNGSTQGSTYGSTQGNTYNSTQGSTYSNIYGNDDSPKRGWSTYAEDKKRKKAERAARRAQKGNGSGNFGIKLAKCASIALVFGLVAGTAFEGSSYLLGSALGTNKQIETTAEPAKEESVLSTTDTTRTASTVSTATDVAAIAKESMPSIVAITNMSEVQYQNWFGQVQNYESESAGSGIIISEDNDYLYIVTNNHVVESAKTLTVQFCDESTVSAEVKGTDKSSDLAVVKVKKSDIETETMNQIKIATLGDSDSLSVGSQAIAIGNALGYGQSVTQGIISALNREVTIQDETTGESFTNDLLQTDAAINPGNSGGALLNSDGEVIGINSSKYSDTQVEGMGFAIPSNTAKPIIEDLITREEVSADKAAYLGISGVDVTESTAQTYDMPEGVYIAQVGKGTAAEAAGLVKGDIITAFDGKKVKTMEALQNTLKYYEAGSKVEITIQRIAEGGYKEQTVEVTLGKKN